MAIPGHGVGEERELVADAGGKAPEEDSGACNNPRAAWLRLSAFLSGDIPSPISNLE